MVLSFVLRRKYAHSRTITINLFVFVISSIHIRFNVFKHVKGGPFEYHFGLDIIKEKLDYIMIITRMNTFLMGLKYVFHFR